MKSAKVTIGVDTPAIKKAIGEAVARVVNEAAKSLRDIRAWCALADDMVCSHGEVGPYDCERCEAIQDCAAAVRALLPALPEVAGEVTEVDGTRVTPGTENDDDREL